MTVPPGYEANKTSQFFASNLNASKGPSNGGRSRSSFGKCVMSCLSRPTCCITGTRRSCARSGRCGDPDDAEPSKYGSLRGSRKQCACRPLEGTDNHAVPGAEQGHCASCRPKRKVLPNNTFALHELLRQHPIGVENELYGFR